MARSNARMADYSDPRIHIAGAYDAFSKYNAGHLQSEFEDKLNNVNGPDEAIMLSGQYKRKARAHFDAGHDGAKA
jgi:hypothetical protein